MNTYEALELAQTITGLPEGSEIDEAIERLFDVDFNTFVLISTELLKLTPVIKTALTNTACNAFVKDNFIIAKQEIF